MEKKVENEHLWNPLKPNVPGYMEILDKVFEGKLPVETCFYLGEKVLVQQLTANIRYIIALFI